MVSRQRLAKLRDIVVCHIVHIVYMYVIDVHMVMGYIDAFEQMPKIHWPPRNISLEIFARQNV